MTCELREKGIPCYEIDAHGKCEPEKNECLRLFIEGELTAD